LHALSVHLPVVICMFLGVASHLSGGNSQQCSGCHQAEAEQR